ncbi:hypothetical protein MFIFM68171_02504 [Madurella fahalii]|uniref:Heterokaryon incompatibility domain-containing protein n=1 Tax=Madurella fahalii TaxID=1157608 RepID=A0ABQ0G3L5_9PEZI
MQIFLRGDSQHGAESGLDKREVPVDCEIIANWIDTCNREHSAGCPAPPISQRDPDQIPSWVLDTQERCIVPGHSVARYAALSYVWNADEGGAPSTGRPDLELKRSTLSDFASSGFFDEQRESCLPRVVDDEAAHAEFGRMGAIYSGAYFTIVAAASFGLSGTTEPISVGSIEELGLTPQREEVNGVWATRGWTFQEHILSRRTIIFLDGAFFWDCHGAIWFDALPNPWGRIKTSDTARVLATSGSGTTGRMWSVLLWPLFCQYLENVCAYNDRDLTCPEDALLAFSGVLESSLKKLSRRIHMQAAAVAVDPYSLRTGFASLGDYGVEFHPLSWRTYKLVEWSALETITGNELRLEEPTILENYRRFVEKGSNSERLVGQHNADDKSRLPLDLDDPASLAPFGLMLNRPFLSCETSSGRSQVRSVLRPCATAQPQAPIKISVFQLEKFVEGPLVSDTCSILCLDDTIAPNQIIQLIAISGGSVDRADLRSSFEEQADIKGYYRYSTLRSRGFKRHPSDGEQGKRLWRDGEGDYHLYNVLWVEYIEGVAYRKAAGRVTKEIWEANCSELKKVILG